MRIEFSVEEKEYEPLSPINVAKALIECGADYEKTFDTEDLVQIAEHLLIYCRHNKEIEQ